MATEVHQGQATAKGYEVGFRSVEREFPEPVGLPVEGSLPAWLTGSVVRSGPAKFEAGGRSVRHWFDGLALLDRFAISDGRVTYSSRMLQSGAYRAAAERGEISYQEFATDPCRSLFKRFVSAFSPRPTDNANVNVAPDGHNWVAMTETPMQVEFDPSTLETAGVRRYDDGMKVHHASAHPHHDAGRRELLSYATAYGPRSRYQLFRLPDGSRTRERYAGTSVGEPCYMHSFALTERHAILTDQPLTVNPLALLLSGRPFIENFSWKDGRGTRFLVFDRGDGRQVGTFETEPFFVFHHVNAFERGGEIVIDACAYDDSGIVEALYMERLRAGEAPPTPRVRRYRIDLASGGVDVLIRLHGRARRAGLPITFAGAELSATAREFAAGVKRMTSHTATPDDQAELRRMLTMWRDNDAKFKAAQYGSFLAQELAPASAQLSQIAAIGLEALDSLSGRSQVSDCAAKLAQVNQATQATPDLLNQVAAPIGELLRAAGCGEPLPAMSSRLRRQLQSQRHARGIRLCDPLRRSC